MKFSLRLLSILFLLVFASCSPATNSITAESTPSSFETASSSQDAYPAPVETFLEGPGYPAPAQAVVIPTITVVAELGQVEGKILLNGQPVANVNIYVCPVIKSEEGIKLVVKFDRTNPLNATIDENGYFRVPNIPAGDYGLVYDTAVDAVLLSNPNTGEQIIFEIQENTRMDLGELNFDELPNS